MITLAWRNLSFFVFFCSFVFFTLIHCLASSYLTFYSVIYRVVVELSCCVCFSSFSNWNWLFHSPSCSRCLLTQYDDDILENVKIISVYPLKIVENETKTTTRETWKNFEWGERGNWMWIVLRFLKISSHHSRKKYQLWCWGSRS